MKTGFLKGPWNPSVCFVKGKGGIVWFICRGLSQVHLPGVVSESSDRRAIMARSGVVMISIG